ncbi:MAG: CidA/LrgA family protein [Rhodobacterales bacterium]|jgi:holin-like protein|nr:CidA/LrgA family protein [Pseudomonadota bacterium]MDA1285913.1 CidA/LrgA family protein [Pseudomonadota bacterium]NQW14394.1 CidA/LrgA family protein [Rhodobacter sp.]HBN32597.1 CidA/LrgA family protein [Paracoccaceae bacterium]
MIGHLSLILGFQLLGEVIARSLGLLMPGPVIGMVLMLLLFIAKPWIATAIRPTAQGLLGHLSLLFVPAGVGVVGHAAALGSDGLAILLALIGSTVAAIAVGAVTFSALARITGHADD